MVSLTKRAFFIKILYTFTWSKYYVLSFYTRLALIAFLTFESSRFICITSSALKTDENLLKAFAGESQARNRYTYFASVAKKDGFEQISAIFL
jgi:hypothetical protein